MRIKFKPTYFIHAAVVVFILAFMLWPGARQKSLKVVVAPTVTVAA